MEYFYNLHPSQKSVLLLDYAVVCKSGKVFFGAVCNLVIPPPLKSGPLEVNKPSIDQLLLWPHRRNEDFQSQPNIWSSKLLLLYRLFEAEIIIVIVIRMVASYMDDGEIHQFLMGVYIARGKIFNFRFNVWQWEKRLNFSQLPSSWFLFSNSSIL